MPDKSKKTEVTILHKVELRLEILWRGNIRLQAASLNENVLLEIDINDIFDDFLKKFQESQ